MKITIITTTYNCEEYIEDTIESILNQKGDFELEYIIFDACSKDKTFEIIKKYENKVLQGLYGENVVLKAFQEPDNGMYDGISKGFNIASGDIVAYINGDDFYLPYAFSTVVDIFEKFENVKWLTGIINCYNSKGQNIYSEKFYNYYPELILEGGYGKHLPFIQQESCFWRKELIDEIDIDRFAKLKLAGDYFLWFSFAKNGHRLYCVDSILSGFRRRIGQKSESLNEYFGEMEEIVGKEISEKKSLPILFLQLISKLHLNREICNSLIVWSPKEREWIIRKRKKINYFKLTKRIVLRCLKLYFISLFLNKKDVEIVRFRTSKKRKNTS